MFQDESALLKINYSNQTFISSTIARVLWDLKGFTI